METVSIIIPAYNSGATIRKCVKSILAQTFTDFCIYIVDDFSTDTTWDELTVLSKMDDRIKIFRNQENSGPSVSRNRALSESKGKWISFIDSDDYISTDYLEKMLKASNGADIVISSFLSVNENGKILKEYTVTTDYQSSDTQTALDKAYGGTADLDFIYNLCWNKLYKRSLFNNVAFPEGRLQEDAFIMPHLLYAASGRVSIAPDALYFYVDNSNSISHASQRDVADFRRRIDLVHLYQDHIMLYQAHGNQLFKRSRANLINNIITIYKLHYPRYAKEYAENFKKLKKTFTSHYISAIKENNGHLSKPLFLTLALFYISPKLYIKIF